jgi:hypothetical protein
VSLASAHGDRPRFVPLGPREKERQHSIAAFRFDLVGVDFKRDGEGTVKSPG